MTASSQGAMTRSAMDRPYLILVLTNLFWGGNVVAGKLAVGHIDAYGLMLLRWTGALALVLPFALPSLRADWPVIRKRWWLYLLYGSMGYATFNILVYLAAHFTSGVNTALEQVAINIFVLAINFLAFRQRVAPLQLVGVVVTIIGVAFIATHGDLGRIGRLDLNFGDLLVLVACLVYAVYSVALRWRPKTSWLSFLTLTIAGAIIASLVYMQAFGGGIPAFLVRLPTLDGVAWGVVAFTVVFPSILSQMFYVRGVELIGSNRASLFINLIPLFGTLGSVLLLGESFELFHLYSATLIAIGIVLAEWSARRRA